MTTPKISAKDLSDQLGIDAKALRVYLRANAVEKDDETGRYLFTAAQTKKHVKDYPAWASHRAEARAAAAQARAAKVDPEQDARDALAETHDPADITDEMVEEMQRLQA